MNARAKLKSQVVSRIQCTLKVWDNFWFAAESRDKIKVFRFLLGLVLFGFYLSRTWDLSFFYSDLGIMPAQVIPDLMQTKLKFSLLYYFKSPLSIWILHSIFLLSLLSLALSPFPKISAAISFILHLSFMHRNMTIAYGVDAIATFFLFCLCFTNSEKNFKKGKSSSAILESVGLRLLQIQVCVIYGYAGFEKLKGVLWWKGEALWYALANVQIAKFDFSWVAQFPLLIVLGTYSTILWEVYFPVLVWVRPVKKYVLFYGVLLHLGIALTVNIPFFAALMICTYVLFLDRQDLAFYLQLSKIFTIKLKSFRRLPMS